MTLDKPLPAQILEFIQHEGLDVGSHLPAQWLADRLRVSRTPVNDALALLHAHGLLERQKNRGYFLAKPPDASDMAERVVRQSVDDDAVAAAYFDIADDLLRGQLPSEVSEVLLRSRYKLTAAQLKAVLGRIAQEGWVQKKPGYGWEFQTMLTTPESLLQSYRLRLALEPAALLEPGYAIEAAVIERCRAAEQRLLAGAIDTDTPDQLHERGVRFHESIIEACGNPFFIDAIRRVNRIRRLISYRSMQDRRRYREHCRQHLRILDLLAARRNAEASTELRHHLERTLANHQKITHVLQA
ncbi:MAG: GntR family transcriptional regulator [Proteobacteria bacterium]|nr:GntR family transcriptional regulator [Pseudomonadota bacterium]